MIPTLNVTNAVLDWDVPCVSGATFPFADKKCLARNYYVAFAISFYQIIMPGQRFRFVKAHGVDGMGINSSSQFALLRSKEAQLTSPTTLLSELRLNNSKSVFGPWVFKRRALLYRETLIARELVLGLGDLFPSTLIVPLVTSFTYPYFASSCCHHLGLPRRLVCLSILALWTIILRNVIRARIVSYYHRPAYASKVGHCNLKQECRSLSSAAHHESGGTGETEQRRSSFADLLRSQPRLSRPSCPRSVAVRSCVAQWDGHSAASQ